MLLNFNVITVLPLASSSQQNHQNTPACNVFDRRGITSFSRHLRCQPVKSVPDLTFFSFAYGRFSWLKSNHVKAINQTPIGADPQLFRISFSFFYFCIYFNSAERERECQLTLSPRFNASGRRRCFNGGVIEEGGSEKKGRRSMADQSAIAHVTAERKRDNGVYWPLSRGVIILNKGSNYSTSQPSRPWVASWLAVELFCLWIGFLVEKVQRIGCEMLQEGDN